MAIANGQNRHTQHGQNEHQQEGGTAEKMKKRVDFVHKRHRCPEYVEHDFAGAFGSPLHPAVLLRF